VELIPLAMIAATIGSRNRILHNVVTMKIEDQMEHHYSKTNIHSDVLGC
jgi:hypothetical protein